MKKVHTGPKLPAANAPNHLAPDRETPEAPKDMERADDGLGGGSWRAAPVPLPPWPQPSPLLRRSHLAPPGAAGRPVRSLLWGSRWEQNSHCTRVTHASVPWEGSPSCLQSTAQLTRLRGQSLELC